MKTTTSLNALRAFHAVAQTLSVTAAARELGVTPGAVSRQIKSLEENVGLALLVRDGRCMRLTADGRELEKGLEDVFSCIDEAIDRLKRPARGARLRVMVPPMFASCWLLPRLDRFSKQRPDTEIILIDSAEKMGTTRSIDLVISWGRLEEGPSVVAERLSAAEKVFPVCRPGICGRDGLAGATLLHYETVGNSWGWPGWPEFIEAVGLDSSELRDGPRLTPALLLDAVRRGKGVMLANDAMALDDLASGQLVRPIAESMRVEESYGLLMDRAAHNRPEVQAFRQWIKGEFAACFPRGGGGGRVTRISSHAGRDLSHGG